MKKLFRFPNSNYKFVAKEHKVVKMLIGLEREMEFKSNGKKQIHFELMPSYDESVGEMVIDILFNMREDF